jgi:hypothetical protein
MGHTVGCTVSWRARSPTRTRARDSAEEAGILLLLTFVDAAGQAQVRASCVVGVKRSDRAKARGFYFYFLWGLNSTT